MTSLDILLKLLKENARTLQGLTVESLFRFVIYAARLQDDILLPQSSSHDPRTAPKLLPSTVIKFLASVCSITEPGVEHCWSVLKDHIWNSKDFSPAGTNFDAISKDFINHGHQFGLCKYIFFFLFLILC